MICLKTVKRVCKDYIHIENYDKAIADDSQTWICHHRLETHTSDNKRRLVDLSVDELKVLDIYWNRPSEELIFLTRKDHAKLHSEHNDKWTTLGHKHTKEAKAKISEAASKARKGCHLSEEHKKKLSEAHKGKHHTEDSKRKMSEVKKGKHLSDKAKKKLSEARKGERNPMYGKHWKLVDGKRVYY